MSVRCTRERTCSVDGARELGAVEHECGARPTERLVGGRGDDVGIVERRLDELQQRQHGTGRGTINVSLEPPPLRDSSFSFQVDGFFGCEHIELTPQEQKTKYSGSYVQLRKSSYC